jgi:hypothetical protein
LIIKLPQILHGVTSNYGEPIFAKVFKVRFGFQSPNSILKGFINQLVNGLGTKEKADFGKIFIA